MCYVHAVKKLWTTNDYRYFNQRSARKQEQRKKHANDMRRTQQHAPTDVSPKLSRPVRKGDFQTLEAPAQLKLFDNPQETIRYCNLIRDCASQPSANIYLDFENVQSFRSDALLLIRAIIDEHSAGSNRHPTMFRGNLPAAPDVAAEFKASGFFDGIANPPKGLPEPKGTMRRKRGTQVYSDIAADMLDFALEHVNSSEECINASWQNLVELMTNTRNHAVKSRGRNNRQLPKTWYVGVYCRDGRAYFNFVDLGVGILRSAPVKGLARNIQMYAGSLGRRKLLEDCLPG